MAHPYSWYHKWCHISGRSANIFHGIKGTSQDKMCFTSSSQAGLWFRPKLEKSLASQIGLCWTHLIISLFITGFSNFGEISHFSKQVLLTPFQKNVAGTWVGCLEPASYLETRCKKSEFSEGTETASLGFVLFNRHVWVPLKHSATPIWEQCHTCHFLK